MAAPIEIEGYKEFVKAARKAADTSIPTKIGEAHKEVGRFVIDKLHPKPSPFAVGEGAGSSVRPSASKREVLLRVGGGWRDNPALQWGKRQQWNGDVQPPKRPFIIGTARKNSVHIELMLMKAIKEACRPAFWKVE